VLYDTITEATEKAQQRIEEGYHGEVLQAIALGHLDLKVAAISANANSFGPKGFVLMASSGCAWQAGGNYLCEESHPVGSVIRFPVDSNGEPTFATKSFEIPEKLPKAPADVVAEVWN
jgi:hypothetical protein